MYNAIVGGGNCLQTMIQNEITEFQSVSTRPFFYRNKSVMSLRQSTKMTKKKKQPR